MHHMRYWPRRRQTHFSISIATSTPRTSTTIMSLDDASSAARQGSDCVGRAGMNASCSGTSSTHPKRNRMVMQQGAVQRSAEAVWART